MNQKIVIFVGKKSQFQNSGVGKYIGNYIPYLKEKFDVEIFYQPENHNIITGNLWRFFKLPRIIKTRYKQYIKIMYDENFLTSVRLSFVDKTIVIVHHYPFNTTVNNFKENIIRWISFITFNTILKKVKNIITVSNKTKTVLENLGIKSKYITVIPNSIDLSHYKALKEDEMMKKRECISKKYNVPINKKWLLYVGSNESRKNLLTLFKILSKLSDEYILVRVGKDGSIEELEKMNKIINENDLENRYYHLQDLSEDDLVSLYQVSDIYLMPSLYEGFGRPIIEAQACGCPVISTKCGALEEVCGDGALLVNDPMNEKEYKEKIIKLNDSKVLESIIKKGMENSKKYSTSGNASEFIDLINKFNFKK